MLIDYQRFRAKRQNLQRLQEFNEVVLQVRWQGIERQTLGERFSVVRFDSFPGSGELPVMHKGPALVIEAPQLAGDEFAVSRKESG